MRDLSRRFKALSEIHRLRIIALLLQHREACVCEVEHFLGVSQSTASRHLRHLAAERIVEDHREGQWVFYRLAEPEDDAHRLLLSMLREVITAADVPDAAEVAAYRRKRCIVASTHQADGRPARVEAMP